MLTHEMVQEAIDLAKELWAENTGIDDYTRINFTVYVDEDGIVRWIGDLGNAVPEPVYNGRALLALQFKPDYIRDYVLESLSEEERDRLDDPEDQEIEAAIFEIKSDYVREYVDEWVDLTLQPQIDEQEREERENV